MKTSIIFGLFSSILLFGCDESINNKSVYDGSIGDVGCPDVIVPAISVSIIEKETNRSMSCGVTVVLEDTNYFEELSNPSSESCDDTLILSGADEREGIYNIHVYKEGYLNWSKYNVEVTTGTCGVNTVNIRATLEK